MQKPNLSAVVDAVVPIRVATPNNYLRLLHTDVAPAIRGLEKDGKIIWYCFLIHNRENADRTDLPEAFPPLFIHFRFGLADESQRQKFMDELSSPFMHPIARELGVIGDIDTGALVSDWADVWWLLGKSSDWALKFAEIHSPNQIADKHIAQFLHYTTNGLGKGLHSVLGGYRF